MTYGKYTGLNIVFIALNTISLVGPVNLQKNPFRELKTFNGQYSNKTTLLSSTEL